MASARRGAQRTPGGGPHGVERVEIAKVGNGHAQPVAVERQRQHAQVTRGRGGEQGEGGFFRNEVVGGERGDRRVGLCHGRGYGQADPASAPPVKADRACQPYGRDGGTAARIARQPAQLPQGAGPR